MLLDISVGSGFEKASDRAASQFIQCLNLEFLAADEQIFEAFNIVLDAIDCSQFNYGHVFLELVVRCWEHNC